MEDREATPTAEVPPFRVRPHGPPRNVAYRHRRRPYHVEPLAQHVNNRIMPLHRHELAAFTQSIEYLTHRATIRIHHQGYIGKFWIVILLLFISFLLPKVLAEQTQQDLDDTGVPMVLTQQDKTHKYFILQSKRRDSEVMSLVRTYDFRSLLNKEEVSLSDCTYQLILRRVEISVKNLSPYQRIED